MGKMPWNPLTKSQQAPSKGWWGLLGIADIPSAAKGIIKMQRRAAASVLTTLPKCTVSLGSSLQALHTPHLQQINTDNRLSTSPQVFVILDTLRDAVEMELLLSVKQ